MSDVCGNHPFCGFFKKYSDCEKAAETGSVKIYCRGPRQGACEREVYRKAHNVMPPDEMMPHGAMIA
jgi:hypothetical protein